jgi:hypothetical protein
VLLSTLDNLASVFNLEDMAIRRECGDRLQTDRKYATHCQTASISLNCLYTFIFKTSSLDTISQPLLQPLLQHTNIEGDAKPLMSNEGTRGSFQLVSLVPNVTGFELGICQCIGIFPVRQKSELEISNFSQNVTTPLSQLLNNNKLNIQGYSIFDIKIKSSSSDGGVMLEARSILFKCKTHDILNQGNKYFPFI